MNQTMNIFTYLSAKIDPDKVPGALLELGLILGFLILLFWWSRSTEKKAIARAREKYKNYTGRAEGRILEHEWVRHYTGTKDSETGDDNYDLLFMVKYEFEVNGQTYRGEGEASGSIKGRKTQTICYDPADPNQNCSLYYLNSQTTSPSCLRLLIYILIRLAIVIGVIFLIMKMFGKL